MFMVNRLISKVIGNKVTFMACGKSISLRLTDHDLLNLRLSSNNWVGDDLNEQKQGFIYNFAIYSLIDYYFEKKECFNEFKSVFPYHNFNEMYWSLI